MFLLDIFSTTFQTIFVPFSFAHAFSIRCVAHTSNSHLMTNRSKHGELKAEEKTFVHSVTPMMYQNISKANRKPDRYLEFVTLIPVM